MAFQFLGIHFTCWAVSIQSGKLSRGCGTPSGYHCTRQVLSLKVSCLRISEILINCFVRFVSFHISHTNYIKINLALQSHVAVAVIQSIPIFDETKLFSIPLPKAIGTSISFSYFLHFYLVLMFLGKCSDKTLITQIFEHMW